jgi:vitamin B12 transporter
MKRLLIVLLIGLSAAQAIAEERTRLEEVVVTASKMAEPEGETTSPVVVIKEEDIKRMNARFVPEVLRQAAGLNLVQSGGTGHVATVFLRGGGAAQVLVMIDGVKVKSPTTGQFDFAGINVEDIERIEIVKGPQSTIYGSEAMGGVINIITKKGSEGHRFYGSYEEGPRGTTNPSVTLSGAGQGYDYRLTGYYFETDGISAAKEGTEKDAYKNASLSGKFGMVLARNFSVEVSGRYIDERAELDFGTSWPEPDDPNYFQDGRRYDISGKGTVFVTDKWEQVLTISTVREKLKSLDPDDTFMYFSSDIETVMDAVDWQHNFYMAKGYSLTVGAEYREETGENRGVFDERTDNTAVYFNSRRKTDTLVSNLGVRHDMHSAFGDKTTWRVGFLEEMDYGMRFRASYGTGFRAPTLNELFHPQGGNPDLKPEESESWELGVEQDYTENVTITLTYFEQKYSDLIQWVEVAPWTWQAQNISRARVKGVESGLSYRITDSFRLNAGYANFDAEDRSTGKALLRRPREKVTVGMDYTGPRLALHAGYSYLGGRVDGFPERKLAAYNLVDLSASYGLTRAITLYARAENLFDEDYEEGAGYGTPGASFYGGVKLSF